MRPVTFLKSYLSPFIYRMIVAAILSGLLFLSFSAQRPAHAAQDSAEEAFKQGLSELKKGDYQAAIEHFTKTITLKPDDAMAYFYRGLALDETSIPALLQGRPPESFMDYTKAIELNPKYAEAYFHRALGHKTWSKERIEDLDRAIQFNPSSAEAYYQRARSLAAEPYINLRDLLSGNFASYTDDNSAISEAATANKYLKAVETYAPLFRRAIEDYSQAIKNKADFTDAYLERASAYLQLEEYRLAVEDFDHLERLNPKDAETYYRRGLAYIDLKEYRKAIEDFGRAIKLKSGQSSYYDKETLARYHAKRALAEFLLGDKEGALDDYLASLRANSSYYPQDDADKLQANPPLRDAASASIEKFAPEILAAARDKEKAADTYYTRALASRYERYAWRDEEIKAIAQDLTEAIRLKTGFTDAYYQRGLIRYELKDDASAIADFTEAIKLSPQNGPAYYNRALASARQKKWAAAIEDFTRVMQLSPEIIDAFVQRGLAFYELGDFQKAVADFSHALQNKPDDTNAYYRLGLVHERLGEREKAVESYQQVLKLIAPKEGAAQSVKSELRDVARTAAYYRGLARLHLVLKSKAQRDLFSDRDEDIQLAEKDLIEQAEKDFTSIISGLPRCAKAYYQRGRTRMVSRIVTPLSSTGSEYQANSEGAFDDFSQAIRLDPKLVEAYIARGQFYGDSLKPLLAIKDFTRAIELDPNNATAYNERGEIHDTNFEGKRRDPGAMLKDFSQVLRLEPDNLDTYLKLASIKVEQKDFQGAIKDYTEIIRLAPDNASAYRERGELRAELKDLRGALEDYNRAIELDPSEPGSDNDVVASTFLARGNLRYRLGDGRGAREDYLQALRIRPCYGCTSGSTSVSQANQADTFFRRGMSLFRRGNKTDSKENLEKAAKLFYAQGNMTQYQNVKYQLSRF